MLSLVVSMQSVLADSTKTQNEHRLEKVRLQLKWIQQFNFAGYVAAVEKGFYREAGLDVELIEGKPGVNFFEEVLSGRAEYGIEMSEILLERNKGKPLVVVAAIFQHSPQIFLMREDSGIKSPQDLIGRRVMWRFDSAAELGAMLKNEGVDYEDIEFIKLSWDINDLIDKKVDAVHAYITAQPFEMEQRGTAYTFLRPINYGVDFYGDCLFTSEKETREHPERVKAFRQASLRGWDYAMENPEELINILITKYGSNASRAFMLNEWETINKLMLPKLVGIGHMNPGRWKHIGDTFVKLGMLKPDYSLKGFIYEPNPEPDYKWIYWTLGIIGTILLIVGGAAVVLILFNMRLKKEVRLKTLELSETNQVLVDDITRRKKAEEALRTSEENYRRLTENLDEIIYSADPETFVCTFINQSVEKIFGYTAEEWIEDPELFYQILHPDDRDRVISEVEEASKTFENIVITYRIIRKDRSIRWIDDHLSWEIKNGKAVSQNGLLYDITERKEAEEAMQKLDKMESMGTLAGGIAHDFNNLLTAILNNLYLIKMFSKSEGKIHDRIESAEKASMKAQSLTQQLLTFARGGAPIREVVDIKDVINESVSLSLRGSNVQYEPCYGDDLWNVEVDEGQMNQVFNNIIINADQSMPDGGTIIFNCDNVSLEAERKDIPVEIGAYVKVSITDHGTGISEENISKIFDPYFTTKEKGNGLGLSTAYSIVKRHGGYIFVESAGGTGTTFHIYLPASKEKISDKKLTKADLIRGEGKILIMDDDELVRDSLGQMVETLGYRSEFAIDGKEAVEAYRNALASGQPFDVVIMDLTIPGGAGGKETIEKLKKVNPRVKAIVSSGYFHDPVLANYRDYGFRAVLPKPYKSIEELSIVLHDVIKSPS